MNIGQNFSDVKDGNAVVLNSFFMLKAFFNFLVRNIKIPILICCPYTFPVKVVGRSC